MDAAQHIGSGTTACHYSIFTLFSSQHPKPATYRPRWQAAFPAGQLPAITRSTAGQGNAPPTVCADRPGTTHGTFGRKSNNALNCRAGGLRRARGCTPRHPTRTYGRRDPNPYTQARAEKSPVSGRGFKVPANAGAQAARTKPGLKPPMDYIDSIYYISPERRWALINRAPRSESVNIIRLPEEVRLS